MKHPNQWVVGEMSKVKWVNGWNKLTIRFLCSNLIKDEIVATALTFWLAFLRSPSTCSSRVSLLSILIPKIFSLHVLEASHYKYLRDDFFIAKKKVKFIWVHFHTVIPKPQSEAFTALLISLTTSSSERPPIANRVLSSA